MKVTVDERFLLMVRDEKDKPLVKEPYPRPKNFSPGEFNSWRDEYRLSFSTNEEAQKALIKVNKLGDFDKAAAWLDKQ